MLRISSKSREVAEFIRDRKPFRTHGALFADTIGENGTGRLPYYPGNLTATDDRLRWDTDKSSIDYIVFSYATPIAWHTTDGRWHKVSQKFSMTTSHHQGRLYLIP